MLAAVYVDVGNAKSPYVETAGATTWEVDAGFAGGKRTGGKFSVAGTDDDAIFTTRRQGNFTYSFPTLDGAYTLSLLFVDTLKRAGRRLFNVEAEGERIESNLDIVARAGRRTALVVSHNINVSGGTFDLSLTGVRGKASLSGFSLTPITIDTPAEPAPQPPIAEPEPPVVEPEPPASIVEQWAAAASAPVALGEVAGGIIEGKLYLVGEGSAETFAYDITTDTWTAGLAPRPHVGEHHAAEVVDGKLYLFGGFNGGSSGTVQIYDPIGNRWTVGAPMPFSTGSASSALIGGKVYVAGGIVNFQPVVGGQTTDQAGVYDPAANTWTSIAPMPRGANHAASATDDTRLYIFGGRDGKGDVLNGFDTVQIYDPATNTWQSSDAGSTLAPLPQPRGGTGKAVYSDGEFFVMGGETKTGSGATPGNVYDGVDVYNVAANTWRQAPAIPTARHGIFPLLNAGRVYVAAGGIQSGNSASSVLEILSVS